VISLNFQKLFSSSAKYFLSNILAAVLPFLLLPILTRYLSVSQYGEVAIFQTLLTGLLAFIGFSAQGAAAVKFYDKNLPQPEYSYFIGSCFLILAISAMCVVPLFMIFLSQLATWLSLGEGWILLSIPVAASSFIILMRMGQWQLKGSANIYGAFQVSQSVINIFLSLFFILILDWGGDGRILALSLTSVIFAIISVLLLYKDKALNIAWRPLYIKEICLFGVPLIPHSLGYFILGSVDRLVINSKLGLGDVGIFVVAMQLVSIAGLFFDALNNAYIPWLYELLKRNQPEEKKLIVKFTYAYAFILMCLVMLSFYIGPKLLILIAGERYKSAAELVGWLMLGQAFNGMYLMVTNYVFFSKKTGLLSVSTISVGIVYIGLLYLLIPHLGLKGAAVAFALSMALKFLFTWYIAHLRYPMPWLTFHRSI